MATQVHVTLVSIAGDTYPTKRTLHLTPARPTIDIGRASSSPNKGIISGPENAWFDSPVMSRAHAKLELDLEDNVMESSPSGTQESANRVPLQRVTLVDVGSMHGTTVNSKAIKANEHTTLQDNDIVVFGAQVTRGTETIPPCAFRVNYEYSKYSDKNGTMTFAFPDSSDVDDDYDVSDNEGQILSSSGDGLSVGSPDVKTTQCVNAIDLTTDEDIQPPPTEANGQLSVMERSEDLLSGSSIAGDDYDDAIPVPSAIILDSSDENEDDYEPVAAEIEYESSDEPISAHSTDAVLAFHHGSSAPYGAQSLEEKIISQYDSESELGLSDAEEEGLRALRELSGKKDSSPLQSPTNDFKASPSISTSAEDRENAFKGSQYASNEAIGSPILGDGSGDALRELESIFRQGSPSAAAMEKPTAIPVSNPLTVHHLPSEEWKSFATQSFQEKANKHSDDVRVEYHLGDVVSRSSAIPDLIPIDISRPKNHDPIVGEVVRNRSPSPLHDMKHTAKFSDSQAVMTGAIMDTSPHSNRSGLRIDDIINNNSSSIEPETRKRKAEDISDVLVGEIQAWASASTLDPTDQAPLTTSTSPPEATSTSDPSTPPGPVPQEPETIPAQTQPSSKRLKKVVEGAAYIALGGVGLFSLLVATAPDFM